MGTTIQGVGMKLDGGQPEHEGMAFNGLSGGEARVKGEKLVKGLVRTMNPSEADHFSGVLLKGNGKVDGGFVQGGP